MIDAVIIAGGKGTRFKSVASDIPKPMVLFNEKPLLEYQINQLKKYGIKNIYFLTGYLSEKIEEYFSDGKLFDVNIKYFKEDKPLGTAGCLKQIEKYISDDFLVLNADLIFDIDIMKMMNFHIEKKSLATIFVHPNDHPFDSDIIDFENDNRVSLIKSKPHTTEDYYRNSVCAGIYFLNKKVLSFLNGDEKKDMCKDLFSDLLKSNNRIFAYKSPEYVKDMGTPDRFEKVKKDFKSGKVTSLNFNIKRPAIFIDRDGVINKDSGLIHEINKFELLPGVESAIKKINNSRYLAIIITNQSVIARNLISFEELENIHNKLEWILGQNNCFIDDIYYCPHHPDSGYPEEIKELKIQCNCRKPNTGMIDKAKNEYNIDIERSFVIGDQKCDILLAKNAGLKAILVKSNGTEWKYENHDIKYENLEEAVDYILNQEENGVNNV